MSAKLTRQELYALIWDRPVTKLAKEFGISDVALHKICRKFRIPTPPVGYWMKKAHGKPITTTPLPDPDDRAAILIRETTASNEPERVAEARLAVLATLGEADGEVGADPIVERTITKLNKVRPNRDGLVRSEGAGLVSVAVRPGSLDRATTIVEKLVTMGARAGLALTKADGAAAWLCDGETITFELVELADRVEHVATEKELASVAKWQREREDYHRRTGYWRDWGEPKIPKWEQRYQGRLAVKLEDVRIKSDQSWWGEGMRRTFADSRTHELTKAIRAIISTVAAMAAAKRHNREFDARRRAAEEEAARQRAAAERRRQLEAKAVSLLGQLLDEQAQLERLRAFVEPLREAGSALPERTKRLLDWAEARRARFEVDLSPAGLEQRLLTAALFEDEEHEQETAEICL